MVKKPKPKPTPKLVALSGSDGFRRRRALRKTIKEQEINGWRVSWADATDPMSIWDAAAADVMFEAPVLVIVENPHKGKIDLYREFMRRPEGDSVLLLYVETKPDTRTKAGKAFTEFLKKDVKAKQVFDLPESPWKREEEAVEFVILEARDTFGKEISRSLAHGIVQRAGTDRGLLHFELLKMSTLAELDSSSTIETVHVKGGLAPLAAALTTPLVNALVLRDSIKVARVLDRIKKTNKGDPTIYISRLLASTVYKWLGPIRMKADGVSPHDAALRLSLNEWYYRNKLLPQCARWTQDEVVELVGKLAESERAVLKGSVNPWLCLTALLLSCCDRVKPPPSPPLLPLVEPVEPIPRVKPFEAFVSSLDEAARIPVKEEWIQKSRPYADKIMARDGELHEARGNSRYIQYLGSKVSEFASAQFLRNLGYDVDDPDTQVDQGQGGNRAWGVDVPVRNKGIPDVHVKSTTPGKPFSGTFNIANPSGRSGGRDPVFKGLRWEEGINYSGKPGSYLAGVTSDPGWVMLTRVDSHIERPPPKMYPIDVLDVVRICAFVPFRWLVEKKLLEMPLKQEIRDLGTKVCFYHLNVMHAMGKGDVVFDSNGRKKYNSITGEVVKGSV